MVYTGSAAKKILMVQTFADRPEWGGRLYHIVSTRTLLRHCLKVFGNRLHPVPDNVAAECIQNAVQNILQLAPDVVGLGGMGRTARRIRSELESAGCKAEIGYWGADAGVDAAGFLQRYGVAPPYDE